MRQARVIGIAMLLLVATTMLVAGTAARAEPLRVLLDGAWAPHHAPVFMAKERGYFAQARIEPLLEPSLGSNSVAVLVGQRAFDLGMLPSSTAAAAIGRGSPIRVVAIHQPRITLAVVGWAGKVRLEGPRSLTGLRLGVTPGTVDSLAMAMFRRANNIGISALMVMPTEPSAKLPGLIAGRLDAVVGSGPALAAGLRADGLEPVVLGLADHGVPLMGDGFVAQAAAVSANADLLRRGLGAIRRGFAAAAGSPLAACEAMSRAVMMQETPAQCAVLLAAYLETTTPAGDADWGRQSAEDWGRMIDAMRAAGEIQGTRPTSFYYSNAVLPAAGL